MQKCGRTNFQMINLKKLDCAMSDHTYGHIFKFQCIKMSHTGNLEILERLFEEVKEEWSIPADCNDNVILFDVTKEVMKRFEELPEPLDLEISH